MKKVALTLILSFGLIGAILTSCFCKDVRDYWMPESATSKIVSFQSDNTPYQTNDTVYSDSILIRVGFEQVYLSEGNTESFNFGNSAFATQKCPINGNEGIKHNVISFEVTCNKDFNSIQAGENLNSLLFLNEEPMSLAYAKTFNQIDLSLRSGYIQNHVDLTFKEKPSMAESRFFTLTWTFENGQILSTTTQDIFW
jgi:hypothetical protein